MKAKKNSSIAYKFFTTINIYIYMQEKIFWGYMKTIVYKSVLLFLKKEKKKKVMFPVTNISL